MSKLKAIAIVGPTSSGKTSLSIEVARCFDGEIVSADSRQVYKGLDIGTGKVTDQEMGGIKHHLLSIVNPMQTYTAAEFEMDASAAIMDIRNRGHLPIVTGGTFFYLDMLRGLRQSAKVPPNQEFRISLMKSPTEELFTQLKNLDPRRAETIDSKNRPRLVRALEIIKSLGHVPKSTKRESPYQWLVIGLEVDKLRLFNNIHTRLFERLNSGMVAEIEELHRQGLSYERMNDLGLEYRYVAKYLQHELKYDEMVKKLEAEIRKFAKRQLTWLKKDKEIEWFKPSDRVHILSRVEEFLNE